MSSDKTKTSRTTRQQAAAATGDPLNSTPRLRAVPDLPAGEDGADEGAPNGPTCTSPRRNRRKPQTLRVPGRQARHLRRGARGIRQPLQEPSVTPDSGLL